MACFQFYLVNTYITFSYKFEIYPKRMHIHLKFLQPAFNFIHKTNMSSQSKKIIKLQGNLTSTFYIPINSNLIQVFLIILIIVLQNLLLIYIDTRTHTHNIHIISALWCNAKFYAILPKSHIPNFCIYINMTLCTYSLLTKTIMMSQ